MTGAQSRSIWTPSQGATIRTPIPRSALQIFKTACCWDGCSNGQVERMNRTLIKATIKRYHYDSHDQLRRHLTAFLAAYNYAKRLKALRGLTPYEYICKIWTDKPDQFRLNSIQQTLGPNI